MSAVVPGTRFARAFAGRGAGDLPGLLPYVTAGFPRLNDTAALLSAAERAGCMGAEVGIPFSDPLADGPTIQRSSQAALSNGMCAPRALEQVAEARARGLRLPLALMTYTNVILAHGVERFASDAASAGADAIIVPDLPAGEDDDVRGAAERCALALIAMVAPTTTPARLAAVCGRATGFVYCVSVTGTTGARTEIPAEALHLLQRVREVTGSPRALGFGLSRHEHLTALRGHAEAAVVGSALMDLVGGETQDPSGAAERFLLAMRGAGPSS